MNHRAEEIERAAEAFLKDWRFLPYSTTEDHVRRADAANTLSAALALPTPPPASSDQVEAVARIFHEAYEEAALKVGWSTQEDCRVPWEELPEANKAAMLHATRAALAALWPEPHPTKPTCTLPMREHCNYRAHPPLPKPDAAGEARAWEKGGGDVE